MTEQDSLVPRPRGRRSTVALAARFATPAAVAFGVLSLTGLAHPLAAVASVLALFGGCLLVARGHARRIGDAAFALRRLADGQVDDAVQADDPALGPLSAAIERVRRQQIALADRQSRREAAERAILDALPDPLLLLGPERTIRRANAAARAEFGQDVEGRNLAAVLRHPALLDAADRALAGETGRIVELTTPSPVLRHYSAKVERAPAEVEDEARALVSLRDVTALKRNERMRADFIANASHELRTPLSSLIGFIETLQGPARGDAAARTRFLPIMHDQATRMARLVDGLMNLSRIETTEHVPPNKAVDLVEVVRTTAAGFELRAKARAVTLSVRLPDAPLRVTGDRDELAQLLQNLIDNAIKYGRAGGRVEVALTHRRQGDSRLPRTGLFGVAVLSVADDGEGVPADHLPRLTERFYRVDEARSRELGGVGLGLAIVKHVVNRHRGLIDIESEPGEGAIFRVLLPCREIAAPEPLALAGVAADRGRTPR